MARKNATRQNNVTTNNTDKQQNDTKAQDTVQKVADNKVVKRANHKRNLIPKKQTTGRVANKKRRGLNTSGLKRSVRTTRRRKSR